MPPFFLLPCERSEKAINILLNIRTRAFFLSVNMQGNEPAPCLRQTGVNAVKTNAAPPNTGSEMESRKRVQTLLFLDECAVFKLALTPCYLPGTPGKKKKKKERRFQKQNRPF